ncbi:MAG: helix-turn-helix transcriptional regulator [Pirellulales bacterium]
MAKNRTSKKATKPKGAAKPRKLTGAEAAAMEVPIGGRLLALRERAGLTQQQVAARVVTSPLGASLGATALGVQRTLSAIESGQRPNPGVLTLAAICAAMGWSIEELLEVE